MKEFEVIEKYLMTYAGVHYKKPINKYDEMMKIKSMGQNARENFIKLGEAVHGRISNFDMYKCTSWISMNQIIPNYLWIQFKKDGFEKCPSSISLSVKKVKETFYFYAAVEIKDTDAEEEDFKNHNQVLDMPLSNSELYYSGDNEEYFNLGKDSQYVKEMIQRREIKKVRIQKNIDQFCKIEEKEIINKIIEAIQILEPYYNRIILSFNESNKVRNKNLQSVRFGEWVITCNPSYYDVNGAFNKLKKIEWKQSVNINTGDIIYIYVGKPFKEIKYKCIAKKVDLNSAGRIDDSEFILDDSNYNNYGRYMELSLLTKYDEQQYPLSKLRERGLKSVQGPSKVSKELSKYIKLIETNLDKLFLGQNDIEDEILIKELKETRIEDFEYYHEYEGGKKKEKQEPKIQNGVRIYMRDKKIAMNAMAHADYLCEIDKEHPTFVRKYIDLNYTEPHHLIPMAYSDLFDVSLDVEENIVSLCSNCHNFLHYGRDYEVILKRLYGERIEDLTKVGLYITFEELLEMYA